MQYPAQRVLTYSTQVLRFMDGSEQRFRTWAGALREWSIRLDLLSEDELSTFRDFFRDRAGRAQSFRFIDPWDGAEYPKCTLDEDDFEAVLRGEGRGDLSLTVRESR
ncbi:MAG: DUF2460 domain-containing protein [Bryobacteraceae bacterium]|nr:DUF2460 domain-containing protein [Bryobacteraceae bacterium]